MDGEQAGMKRCAKCRLDKGIADFYKNARNKDGLQDYCKPCNCAATMASAKRRRQTPVGRRQFRNTELKRAYGITLDTFEGMLSAQGGRCAICESESHGHADWTTFAVDHDHATGAVRGLLCTRCNSGIGYFRDRPETLEKAIAYLRKHARSGLS